MWCSGLRPEHFPGIAGRAAPLTDVLQYCPVLGGPGPLDIMTLPKSINLGYGVFFDHILTPERLHSRDCSTGLPKANYESMRHGSWNSRPKLQS
jgi:hypothetical protein